MAHPKDRSGLTRRQLLRGRRRGSRSQRGRAARGLREHDDADRRVRAARRGRLEARRARSRSARAGCRCRAPTTPSRGRSPPTTSRSRRAAEPRAARSRSTTTPTTSTRASSSASRSSTTQGPDRDVQLRGRGDREARRRARSSFDVIIGLSGSNIVNLIAQQLLQPLNHSYLPNLAKNIWPELQDPFYDRGTRYTVPYVVWRTGSAGATTRSRRTSRAMDVPWDIFWQSQPYNGKVGLLDDKRDALSMPMQRDAMRTGVAPRPQHRGSARSSRRRATTSRSSRGSATSRSRSPTTRRCPRRRPWLHHSWSGDLLSAAIYYMPKGASPTSSRSGRPTERRRPERLPLHRPHREEPGARARVPRLHARREERVRQLRQLQRLRAAAEGDRRRVADQAAA